MALQGKYGLLVLAAALLAGSAIGFASTSLAYRLHWLEAPGQNLIDRMSDDLALTPSQREQVGEVMRGTHERVTRMRADFQHQRRRLLLDAYLKISAVLSPDQRARFDREFVPPRFRDEALKMGRSFDAPAVSANPPAPPAAGNAPDSSVRIVPTPKTAGMPISAQAP
jgi:Spy/CpxP family protein refolding chaperone